MDVKISKISEDENELVDIRCHEETDHVREIADFVRSRQGQLNGMLEGRQYETLNLTGYRLNFYGQTLEGDQLDEVIKKMKEADIVVMGSPVYWHNICAEHSRSLSARYIPKRARLGNSSPWLSPRNRKASLKKLKYCCKDVTLQRFESKL